MLHLKNASQIRPTKDRILAEPINPPDRVGLLWIPENKSSALKTWFKAKVHAVGPKVEVVKPGDTIIMDCYGGDYFEIERKKFCLIRECHIGGVSEVDINLQNVVKNEQPYPDFEHDADATSITDGLDVDVGLAPSAE